MTTTLAEMGEQIRTQNNAATGHPIFMVQQRRRIYGMDLSWDGEWEWIDEEGNEAGGDERLALEEWRIKTGDQEHDGFRRVGYTDLWEAVQPFFTRVGAERYIATNKHNLCDPRVYVESAYRNHEWQNVRDFLSDLDTSKLSLARAMVKEAEKP